MYINQKELNVLEAQFTKENHALSVFQDELFEAECAKDARASRMAKMKIHQSLQRLKAIGHDLNQYVEQLYSVEA